MSVELSFPFYDLGKGLSLNKLHYYVVDVSLLAHVVDLDYVGIHYAGYQL